MRIRLLAAAAFCAAAAPAAALAEGSYTTRIEPRAFYGASVSIEQGVRVWRPLPPVRHVIINPDHGTALSLGFTDVRETRTNNNYNYSHDGERERGYGYAGGVGFPDGARRPERHRPEGGVGRPLAPR